MGNDGLYLDELAVLLSLLNPLRFDFLQEALLVLIQRLHVETDILLGLCEKIAFFLKEEQRRQQSNTIQLSMSRQELADHFSIQKYSLQRALNELQESGAIRVDGKTIEILSFPPVP